MEEISGVAFIFNQKFFQDLKEETGGTLTFLQTRPLSVLLCSVQGLGEEGTQLSQLLGTGDSR